MSSQGPTTCGTAADANNGQQTWTNVTNMQGSSAYATCSMTTVDNNTDNANCSNYGFSIPSGATINGIVVTWTGYDSSGTKQGNTWVQLLKAGSLVGSQEYNLAMNTTSSTYTYGSSSSLSSWGSPTLAYSDVNNSGFGVAIWEENGSGNNVCHIQNVQLTVYYSGGVAGVPTGLMAPFGGSAPLNLATGHPAQIG